MKQQQMPEVIVALYDSLASAQAAMENLEHANVPYPDVRLAAHTSTQNDLPNLEVAQLPEQFWSLQVTIEQRGVYHAEDILRQQQPLAIGRLPAPNAGRSDTDLGALAWRHYVFETDMATDHIGDLAGTTGNTGIINNGVFADNTLAEGNPPVRGLAGSHARYADTLPSIIDQRHPATIANDSRPDPEMHA